MGCGCGKKKPYFQPVNVEKITVACPDCETGLVGIDGMYYPVNETNVQVTPTQFDIWVTQGHPVQKVN